MISSFLKALCSNDLKNCAVVIPFEDVKYPEDGDMTDKKLWTQMDQVFENKKFTDAERVAHLAYLFIDGYAHENLIYMDFDEYGKPLGVICGTGQEKVILVSCYTSPKYAKEKTCHKARITELLQGAAKSPSAKGFAFNQNTERPILISMDYVEAMMNEVMKT